MGETGQMGLPSGGWGRRAWIALAVLCGLLLIFHRPLLFGLGYRIALHQAAKENLRLQFQVEGNIFNNLAIRNFHAPSIEPMKCVYSTANSSRVMSALSSNSARAHAIAFRRSGSSIKTQFSRGQSGGGRRVTLSS